MGLLWDLIAMSRKQRTIDELFEDYCSFTAFLDSNNFNLEHSNDDRFYFRTIFSNRYIKGIIIVDLKGDQFKNWIYSARVYSDHRKCWNKMGTCPFQMKLPTQIHFQYYLNRIKFWGSKEGLKISSNYDYHLWDKDI